MPTRGAGQYPLYFYVRHFREFIMFRQLFRGFLSVLIGGIGGFVFWKLGLPLPWMMGSMMATAIASVWGYQVASLTPVRPLTLAVVGTMLGSSFTASFFLDLQRLAVPMVGLFASSVIGAVVAYAALRRFSTLPPETAYFAAMPGGIVEMVTMAEENGGDARTVALMHASRIFLVVLCLPFIFEFMTGMPAARSTGAMLSVYEVPATDWLWFAGVAFAGIALSQLHVIPIRQMLAPMLVSMVVHVAGWTDFKLPFELIAVAQVLLGIGIGARFAGISRQFVFRTLLLSMLTTGLLIASAVLVAMAVAAVADMMFPSLLLSYAPGGLAEMGLIALAMELDVALVSASHLARIVMVVIVATLVFNGLKRRFFTTDRKAG